MYTDAIMAEKSKKLVLCGHCDEYVSKSTFYQHRRLYYNFRTQKWSQSRVFNSVGLEDFEFGHSICQEEDSIMHDTEPVLGMNYEIARELQTRI